MAALTQSPRTKKLKCKKKIYLCLDIHTTYLYLLNHEFNNVFGIEITSEPTRSQYIKS